MTLSLIQSPLKSTNLLLTSVVTIQEMVSVNVIFFLVNSSPSILKSQTS